MKNYLFMSLASICIMLAFSVVSVPIDVGESDLALVVDDVGVSTDVVLAVDYDLQTHWAQTRINYVADNYSIPADELIPKPGWQSVLTHESFNDKQKRILFKTYINKG